MGYRIGVALAVLGSAFVYMPDSIDTFGQIKVLMVLSGAFVAFCAQKAEPFRPSYGANALAAVLIAAVLSTAVSMDRWTSSLGLYNQPFGGLTIIVGLCLLLWAVSSVNESGDFEHEIASWTAGVVGLICVVEFFFAKDQLWITAGRVNGTMGHPAFAGALLAVCLPSCRLRMEQGKRRAVLFMLLAIVGIMVTKSRGAMLAAAAGLWAFYFLQKRSVSKVAASFLASLILCAVMIGPLISKGESDIIRIETWKAAVRAGIDRPILGWGLDNFPVACRRFRGEGMVRAMGWTTIQTQAHNDLLQAWATTGIVGLLALLFFQFVILRRVLLLRLIEHHAAAGASLFALFIQAKVNPVPPPVMAIGAVMAGMILSRRFYEPRSYLWKESFLAIVAGLIAIGGTHFAVHSEHEYGQGVKAFNSGRVHDAANLIRRSQQSQPMNLEYAFRRLQLIDRIMPFVSTPERKEFAKRGLRFVGEIAISRPGDPAAVELMSAAELFAAPILGARLNCAGMQNAKRSIELDPMSGLSASKWVLGAMRCRRKDEFDLARPRVDRIIDLTGNRFR